MTAKEITNLYPTITDAEARVIAEYVAHGKPLADAVFTTMFVKTMLLDRKHPRSALEIDRIAEYMDGREHLFDAIAMTLYPTLSAYRRELVVEMLNYGHSPFSAVLLSTGPSVYDGP